MDKVFLIARREFLAYVSTWGFWVSLVTTPLLMGVFALAPTVLRNSEPARVITIVADNPDDLAAVRDAFAENERARTRRALRTASLTAPEGVSDAALEAFDAQPDTSSAVAAAKAELEKAGVAVAFSIPAAEYILIDPPAPDPKALEPLLTGDRTLDIAGKQRPLFAALFVSRSGPQTVALDYWSDNVTSDEPKDIAEDGLKLRLKNAALSEEGLDRARLDAIDGLGPTVNQYRPGAESTVSDKDRAPILVAVVLMIVLWTSIFSIINMLLTGVIEEKSNKILDTLLTSVAPWQMLTGKLIGVATLSLTMFLIWGGLGAGVLVNAASGAGGLLGGALAALSNPSLIIIFFLSFVLGYILFGVLYLAIGSLCETLNESQTLVSPLTLLLFTPVLLIGPAFSNPDSPLIVGLSWVPLFSPFLLIVRAGGGMDLAEALPPLALTAATVVIVLLLAGRVFGAGATGQLSMDDVKKLLGRGKKAEAKA